MSSLPAFVITLDCNYTQTAKYKELKNLFPKLEIVSGIIADDEIMSTYPYNRYQQQTVGSVLAHQNCWNLIEQNNYDKAIIFEDDVIPLYPKEEFLDKLNKIIDTDYDILKLHSDDDMCLGSVAAYVINKSFFNRGIGVSGLALDVELFLKSKIANWCKLICPINLFKTDETGKLKTKKTLFGAFNDKFLKSDRQQRPTDQALNYPLFMIGNIPISSRSFYFVVFVIPIFIVMYLLSKRIFLCSLMLLIFMFIFFVKLL
tara:strand:+ start:296 stop:1072 length:777 start_codon:yes stop_codon:yes gene_type:complete